MSGAGAGSATRAHIQTPPGRGGIAVIAVAGRRASEIVSDVFRPLTSRAGGRNGTLHLGHLTDGETILDEALVHSGRESIEINIHGGPAAARAALELLARRGAKIVPARPEEAFDSSHPRWSNAAVGREMLRALPSAGSVLVAAAVTRQWSAGLSELAAGCLGGKLPTGVSNAFRRAAESLPLMRRLLDPPEVVLAGPPNAGKSSLMNALVGRPVSVVHGRAGTTRDWIREPAVFPVPAGGVPLLLTDTAGIWDAPGGVDAEAVRRARRRAESADLVLLLDDDAPSVPDWLHPRRVLSVRTKADLGGRTTEGLSVSTWTGESLDALRSAVTAALGLDDADPERPAAFTDRQAALLVEAADALDAGEADAARRALRHLLAGPLSDP